MRSVSWFQEHKYVQYLLYTFFGLVEMGGRVNEFEITESVREDDEKGLAIDMLFEVSRVSKS